MLGSTLNPFATGAAVAAAGVDVNMGTIFVVAIILWLGTFILSALFVTAYAKKVKDGKGSILTAEQISECKAAYGTSTEISSNVRLTGRQKGWRSGWTGKCPGRTRSRLRLRRHASH